MAGTLTALTGKLRLDQFFGGKAWYKSMVGWAILIFVMAETAVPEAGSLGLIDAGTVKTLSGYMSSISAVLGILGIRRRLPATGTARDKVIPVVVK